MSIGTHGKAKQQVVSPDTGLNPPAVFIDDMAEMTWITLRGCSVIPKLTRVVPLSRLVPDASTIPGGTPVTSFSGRQRRLAQRDSRDSRLRADGHSGQDIESCKRAKSQ